MCNILSLLKIETQDIQEFLLAVKKQNHAMAHTVQLGMTCTLLLYWNQDSWQPVRFENFVIVMMKAVSDFLMLFFLIQGELCVQILWQNLVEDQRVVGQCCLKRLRMQPMQYVSFLCHEINNLLLWRREVWRHKNSNLWSYGIGWHIQKEQDERAPLPKISLLVQVGGWILGPVCSDDSIQILLKLAWIITSSIQPVFKDLDGVIRVYIINIIFFCFSTK